jgi:hypothetical protein
MIKFAGMSYDATDMVTEGRIDYLVNLTKNDPDELTKNAHIPSREEVEEMPTDQFALVVYHPRVGQLKKFATHDKYVTKLNLKILQDTHSSYPDEIAKTAAFYLAKAAKFYRVDVPAELQKLAEGKHQSNVVDLGDINETAWVKKQSSMEKQAQETDYALPDKKKYPISTPEHIKTAISYFDQNLYRFSPMDALQYAVRVKLAADKSQVSYEGTKLEKYSNLTASSFNPGMRAHIKSRKGYASEDDAAVYDELLDKSAVLGVVKTAEYLEQVDRKLGLHRQWGIAVEDPYISVLGMRKEAECSHKGKKVKKSMLKKAAESIVDEATLKELEGPDGIAVFESLPTPIKDKITKNL